MRLTLRTERHLAAFRPGFGPGLGPGFGPGFGPGHLLGDTSSNLRLY